MSHRLRISLLVATLAFAVPHSVHAQGCSQCRDNTASTSPATQRAYRHAIELMTGAASALCVATFFILKRNP